MSFAFTKDETIGLSKALEGEDHLGIVGREECDSIVEKLLNLGKDEIGHKRDSTIGLYDRWFTSNAWLLSPTLFLTFYGTFT